MNSNSKRYLIAATMGLSLLFIGSARAQLAAVSINSSTWSTSGGTNVYGWSFTTNTTIRVSSLGLYDAMSAFDGGFFGDGFAGSHPIGLWDVADQSTPIVTSLIPAGTEAELIDGFRYIPISPVVLTMDREYVIAAAYRSEDNVVGTVNNPLLVVTASPAITVGDYRFGTDATELGFPENFEPGPVSGFGPNFIYTPIPEPSTLPFCIAGILLFFGSGTFGRTRRKRRSGLKEPEPKRRCLEGVAFGANIRRRRPCT